MNESSTALIFIQGFRHVNITESHIERLRWRRDKKERDKIYM
jgi:hypothetical protein